MSRSSARPWRGQEALLLGHSQMEGMAPYLRAHLLQDGARVVHTYAERGTNVARLRRAVYAGRRVLNASLADEIPLVVVALSGNGAVTGPLALRANLDWLRAEYPRALIAWLGHTITETGTAADQERARAAELEAREVPARSGFVWIDMRVPGLPLSADGVHHTRAGYERLADHAWSRLQEQAMADNNSVPWAVVLGGGAVAGVLLTLGARWWMGRGVAVGED
ncbi:MAG: hypothetical protein AB8I08_32985 [Sandaracinaceae bacterium]